MASNSSKPYQAQRIRGHGFAVPDTLVTTDPAAADAFWQRHGEIIYKSVSGTRSRVARLRPEDVPRLQDVSWCPTQFQEYVPGREHRVHVVGGDVFACEVLSEADDYRYAPANEVTLRACDLPVDVAARCRHLAADLSLPVAGIDLRLGPGGLWYCFEVNPMPAFSCYESAAARPISAAVARLLAGAAPATRTARRC
jgi:glutathione synthase/RimK-type ligase-like ATP-grasp enzyme